MSNTPSVEVLTLQLQVARLQAELLAANAEIGRYRHRELQQQAAQLQQAIQQAKQRAAEPAPAAPAQSPTADPPPDDAMQAELARIAAAGPNDLPSIITKQAQHDDGSPRRDADGNVILLHQDGTPLSVIERAIIARQAELRAAAGGG
jgi:hypothetical protein